jgi:ubiquitin carboxyl-terminal hydrolase L5
MAQQWNTIESDPGCFTDLMERIGVRGVEVTELWSLDAEQLRQLAPVFGLIFLFKWGAANAVSSATTAARADPTAALNHADAHGVYFAKQVIANACATQALTAILLNANDAALDIGATLRDFKQNTRDFPPEMRGLALGNVDSIREAHNSFARPEPFITEAERPAKKGDDVFHFVSFLAVGGRLWELDGLAPAPIDHGECPAEQFPDKIVGVLERRIALYTSGEIKFALMALVRDRRAAIAEQIATLAPDAPQLPLLQADLAAEDEKRRQWALENVRRRHNYIPFIVRFLDILGQSGKLENIIAAAQERHEQKIASDSKRARKQE